MGRKRNMPSRKKILEYWSDKINGAKDENSCFKCGFNKGTPHRAHIKAVFQGGTDDVSNIHLLCRNCHIESEAWDGQAYDLWFKEFDDKIFKIKLTSYFLSGKIELNETLSNMLNNFKKEFIDNYGLETFNKEFNEIKNFLVLYEEN